MPSAFARGLPSSVRVLSSNGLPDIQGILLEFAILVGSLSFHEAAHAWTADRLGDPTARQLGRLTLNPMAHVDWVGTVLFPLVAMFSGLPLIGWARPVPVDMRHLREPRRDFAIVAAAGPASNLLLAIVAAALYHAVSLPGAGASTARMLPSILLFVVMLNLLLAVFNLIPVPPLDGGNVLMGLVPERSAAAIRWLRPYGFVILYGLMFSGVLYRIMDPIQTVLFGWLI